MTTERLLVAVEGAAADDAAVTQLLDALRSAGHEVMQPPLERPLGRPGQGRIVLVVPVSTADDAGRAVEAALRGFSVVVIARGERAVLDLVYDDLRRFGRVTVRSKAPAAAGDALHPDGRELLELLGRGMTLGDAAATLHLSRRTADRRLADARRALDVSTTVEAVARLRSSTLA